METNLSFSHAGGMTFTLHLLYIVFVKSIRSKKVISKRCRLESAPKGVGGGHVGVNFELFGAYVNDKSWRNQNFALEDTGRQEPFTDWYRWGKIETPLPPYDRLDIGPIYSSTKPPPSPLTLPYFHPELKLSDKNTHKFSDDVTT